MIEYINNKIEYIKNTLDFIEDKMELGTCLKEFCILLMKETDYKIRQLENLQVEEATELRKRWIEIDEKIENNC